ncbi:hypothetical protein RCH18_001181 [Flavobacterium sp. PL11]|nr:hypothetical protein [Flavobacterium sp. PL11]
MVIKKITHQENLKQIPDVLKTQGNYIEQITKTLINKTLIV